MTEAVQAQQIMLAAMAGAMVVVFGAVHAFFLAFAKLRQSRTCLQLSYLAYALFVVMTLILAWTLHLTGFWFVIVLVMLLGYLLAPYGIWHLSVATHAAEHEERPAGSDQSIEGDFSHE